MVTKDLGLQDDNMNFNHLWVEKYRPNSLDNIVLSNETRLILENFKNNKDIPHLLFVSTPGTGKTTTAKIIVNELLKCDYLYINASDENGIDTIRHKIIGFAQTKSFDGGIKVVILDEADSLSGDGARALRNVMEEYASNTRFILTANYKHRILDAIRSRCIVVDFTHNLSDFAKHCAKILSKEGISIPQNQITPFKTLVKASFPDFRKTINSLQKYSITGALNIQNIVMDDQFLADIITKIQNEDICNVRKYIISNEMTFQSDYHSLLKGLFEHICEKLPDSFQKKEALWTIAQHMDSHTRVIDVEINCFACMIAISKLLCPSNS